LLTSHFSYFAERGIWDEQLGTFINSDGNPTQFSVCHGNLSWGTVTIIYSSVIFPFFVFGSPSRQLHGLFSLVRKPYYGILLSPETQRLAITTVGYGEITPRSFLGRLITLPILVFGLLLITLPSFVLGREFSHVWEKMSLDRVSPNNSLFFISFQLLKPLISFFVRK
jgi:potassium voltage-gated channel Shal-related subfamily D protein 2